MRNQVFATVAMALLGACVGGIDNGNMTGGGDDDGSGGTAQAMFASTVAPLLTAKCAGCHVGPETSATNMFLGADGASSYYTTLTNDRAVNGGFDASAATILSKGAHEGPAWTSDESAKITAWLGAELKARGTAIPPTGGTGPNLASANGASMAFVGCMQSTASMTDYTTLQAYQVANLNTEDGRCFSCHSPGGAGGQYLGIDNKYLDMYAKWQQAVFFTGVFQAQLQTATNTYKIGTAETKICAKGKEKTNGLGTHPTFDCTQNNKTALTNLAKFATVVQARVDAKDPTCAAAAFATPTP